MASFSSSKPFGNAVLVSTSDSGITGLRNWTEAPASLVNNKGVWTATAPLAPQTTAWFLNLKTGDLIASTDFQEVALTKTPRPTVPSPDESKEQKTRLLFNRIDENQDALISQKEYVVFYENLFPNLDKNHDSLLDKSEFTHEVALRFGDTDEDGALSEKEYVKIFVRQHNNLDSDNNGDISLEEWGSHPQVACDAQLAHLLLLYLYARASRACGFHGTDDETLSVSFFDYLSLSYLLCADQLHGEQSPPTVHHAQRG